MQREREQWNGARWTAGDPSGHYESWFCRANDPGRPLAFWIRYTIFSPAERPGDALGELWAVAFDGERRSVVAVKEERPVADCTFAKSELSARIGEATLDAEALEGEAACAGHRIGWDLRYTSPAPPLLLLDRSLYGASFPKAKALVGAPFASFGGTLRVDDDEWPIDGWIGSQNHNWGEKHTDRYAWGQVAGFDGAPDAFLEAATAQVKIGPVTTPTLTVMVLRLDGEELAFNTLGETLRTRGEYDFFQWRFEGRRGETSVRGTITAGAEDFVGLPYLNPPGGVKTCLNTKLASCAVTVRRGDAAPVTLYTRSRAAFEILTDAPDHGVRVLDPHA
ncbi:MAG TPA: hypothetical protein RMH99_25400 [Sandaracinaceae bacterium LLY-WYZ-13_1]|nr:hypothetical protein [Sandaracinaceae bacterium LLY-WYZ-13_1]